MEYGWFMRQPCKGLSMCGCYCVVRHKLLQLRPQTKIRIILPEDPEDQAETSSKVRRKDTRQAK